AVFLLPSSMAMPSGRQWWYGAGSVLYLTEDAGGHWRELGSAPRGIIFTSIQGVDGSHGWAVATRLAGCSQAGPCRSGASGVGRIDDGGRQLSVVKVPAGNPAEESGGQVVRMRPGRRAPEQAH